VTTLPNQSPRPADFALFGIISAIVIGLLYGLNPYAHGYGSELVTVFHFMRVVWTGSEDWEHCFLVPFAIGAMIYFERHNLPKAQFENSRAGFALLAFGLFVYWVGYRADNIYIAYASLQLVVGGLVFWMMGWTWAKALFIPWAFMVFLFPLVFLDNLVAFPLRMVMSEASVHVLNFLGIASVKSGTALLSAPDMLAGIRAGAKFSVDVADPCSGIRSLFALMMVSALYGYFTQKTLWKKAALFLCSIPLAIMGNLARILMLTLGTIAMGPEIAIGTLDDPTFFHMLAGYLVFAVALCGMLGVASLLNADWPLIIGRFRKNLERTPVAPVGPTTKSAKPRQDEY